MTSSLPAGGRLCWAFGGVVIRFSLSRAPPSERPGGWYVALCANAVAYAGAYLLLRRRSRVGFGGLLASSYVGIAQVAIVEWLAGGHDTPYHLLYLVAAILPPACIRRGGPRLCSRPV